MTDEKDNFKAFVEFSNRMTELSAFTHEIKDTGLEPSITITDLTLEWKPTEGWSIDMEGKGLEKDVVELIERAKNEGIVLETKQDVLDYEKAVDGIITYTYPSDGVDLSAFAALVPVDTPLYGPGVPPRSLTRHTKKELRKMSKKRMRKLVLELEARVAARELQIRGLMREQLAKDE
jgi:hypothetical protein